MHSIRLSYFQGPRYHLSFMLSVAGPDNRRLHPFNIDDFKPPSDPADWKYGSIEDLGASDPDAGSGLIAHGNESAPDLGDRRRHARNGSKEHAARERYFITFRAPDGEAKTIHNLSVDLTPEAKARLQDYKIRARGGYLIGAR